MLRALFWLRRWFGIPIAGFYVPSGRNPADPPSRVHDFDSMSLVWGQPVRGTGNGNRHLFPTRTSLHWPLSRGSVHRMTAQIAPLAFVAVDGA